MKDIFLERNLKYNLRNNAGFKTKNISTVRYGMETISYLGPKIYPQLDMGRKQLVI